MKVYLVVAGDYEGTDAYHVCTTEKLAIRLKKELDDDPKFFPVAKAWSQYGSFIEEHELRKR